MISACMTVSVRELRTAVREWACWRTTLSGVLSPFSSISRTVTSTNGATEIWDKEISAD